MVYLVFEAMPDQETATRENVAGAYVNCWVDTDDPVDAQGRARSRIADEGWTIVGLEECRVVDTARYAGTPTFRYIEEAFERGVSLVYHYWAADGEAIEH